jgi:hypothetical protein
MKRNHKLFVKDILDCMEGKSLFGASFITRIPDQN